jgi:hypothetical protein
MKMKMNIKKQWIPSVMVVCAAVVAVSTFAKPAKKHGTDILHFFVGKTMTNEGVESGAAGSVDAKQNEQGNANNERLLVKVTGLTTNTAYQLFAVLDDDTNNYVQVADFNTDASGKASLDYNHNGNGKALGNKTALPQALDPLAGIRSLAVFNTSTQAVLTADLTAPDKLQYLIKRDLSTNNVEATLRIKATTQQTQFRLMVSGLNPTNDYLLVLNGGIVQTNGTDDKGRLVISSLVQNPVDILDLRNVALWDSVSNLVLTTDLP